MLRLVVSPRSEERLSAAEAFLCEAPSDTEVLLVGASRGAALDLAARVGAKRGATFGLHRLTLGRLAARLAAIDLAKRGIAPASPLAIEAVVTRAVADALAQNLLDYFAPVAKTPSFSRTLCTTIAELRAERIGPDDIRGVDRRSSDIRTLLRLYEEHRARAKIADHADVLFTAAAATREAADVRRSMLVLVDVPITSRADESLVTELVRHAKQSFACVPMGDGRAERVLSTLATSRVEPLPDEPGSALSRLCQYIFAAEEIKPTETSDDVAFFSAPGERRECVEIARRILAEARRGVRFDDVAVFLRAPEAYAGLLESAFARAKIPAHFAFGSSQPEPSGRALLALLACRAEDFSSKRFAEFLSLAPTNRDVVLTTNESSLPSSRSELLGALLEGQPVMLPYETTPTLPKASSTPLLPTLLWERLLAEASIVGRKDRWPRRLDALGQSFDRELHLLRQTDSSSPRIDTVERESQALRDLSDFALPLIEALAALPQRASWKVWLEELGRIATMALEDPSHVITTFTELDPMADVEDVAFDEVRRVLEGRLGTKTVQPSGRRYGEVFVGTPDLARGRSFAVVFVPGLAERLFPEAPREDPILLDADRRAISKTLWTQTDRGQYERLLLRLSVGAARQRVHLSYPRVEVTAGRPRMPSFYGLDVRRATTGILPDHDTLERDAATASGTRLAWPAPALPEDAIDDAEHDLAMLGLLLHSSNDAPTAGRAQYLLDLNPHLARSLRSRSARWDRPYSHHDGVIRKTAATAPVLNANRLRTRSFAVTAIEKFAACPYRFLLAAIHRIPARERRTTPDRLDPITRGVLFHRVQAAALAALEKQDGLPLCLDRQTQALRALDQCLDKAARDHEERVLPTVSSVFWDEIERMRIELHGWMMQVIEDHDHLELIRYDLSFGLPLHEHEDPRSMAEAAKLNEGFLLHGAIDVVERHVATSQCRVTDIKTGTSFAKPTMVIGGGEVLQPVLYALSYEAVWNERVVDARLSFCTHRGGHTEHVIALDGAARERAKRVLELVDDAIDKGFFPAAPRENACDNCGYRIVCGPHEERRAARKDESTVDDGVMFSRLRAIRSEP
ncbi:MAG: PD-(D/E)XK nuclease family protein [Polyangiaceae bacterium]|nr:PD-(D/E)XK nuclease family protein [Polyangiaceae bacterium]